MSSAAEPVGKPATDEEPSFRLLRDQLLATLAAHHPGADPHLVADAFAFALVAHAGVRRAGGEPYVTHPIAVAQLLADLGLDAVALAAALLHDVPEDTEHDVAEIEERFGRDVARLVDGVTKLSRFSTHTHEQAQAENIRKMFLAMADDIRVVLIKLADRLHNMRTLDALPAEKRERIAAQTMEIYAPLAERLGVWQVKWELEDLAFRALEPERFREIARRLDARRAEREAYVERAVGALRPALSAADVAAELSGRAKHLYSIARKMERKGAELSEIYDAYAIRLLVDSVPDCYAALGVVHGLWRPIPAQFDDYIAVPKPNGYQSLHTVVIALDGAPLEIQIRTHAMHAVSEVGVAAHFRYKEGSRADRAYDAKLAWLRSLMDWQSEIADASEFVEGIKLDVFQDQVFVFTPKGDVKDLPAGATPLDFAYRVHTDIGHRTIGAKVNNRLVPLEHRLHNGDIVEIVTAKGEAGPSRDWLTIAQTSHARSKIRAYFKHRDRTENIAHGRETLDRELRRLAHTSIERLPARALTDAAKAYGYDSTDDLYAGIGHGATSATGVVGKLGVADDAARQLPEIAPPRTAASSDGIRVAGMDDLLVRFAGCCHPVPGDLITGFVTRGKGVTVHLATCRTATNATERDRLIAVEWSSGGARSYPVSLRIDAHDRTGLLADIAATVADARLNIVAASVGVAPDGMAIARATVLVGSVAELTRVMGRLEAVRDVVAVARDAA